MNAARTRRALTDDDTALLSSAFGERTVQRGLSLYRRQAVLHVSLHAAHDPTEQVLEAMVQGTRSYPYDVTVFLDAQGRAEESECTCPVDMYCKHAVAAFLEHRGTLPAPNEPNLPPGGRPRRGRAAGSSARAPAPSPASITRERLDDWLNRFARISGPEPVSAAPGIGGGSHVGARRRVYALEPGAASGPDARGAIAGATLSILEATRTRAGRFNKGRRHRPKDYYAGWDTQVDGLDREIAGCGAALLVASGGERYQDDGRYRLVGRLGFTLLELALSSERLFPGDRRDRPFERGEACELRLDWCDGADAQGDLVRTLRVRLDGLDGLNRWWAVPTDPPMYVDPEACRIGPLSTALSGAQLLMALEAPDVPEQDLAAFADALESVEAMRPGSDREERRTATAPLIPRPSELDESVIEAVAEPVLFLHSPAESAHVDSWVITVMVRYGELMLPCTPSPERASTRVQAADGRIVRVRRDRQAERDIRLALLERFPDLAPAPSTGTDGRIEALFEKGGGGDRLDRVGALLQRERQPVQIAQAGDILSGEADLLARAATPAARFDILRGVVGAREALEADGWQLVVLPPVHTDTIRPDRFEGLIERDANEPGWFDISLGFVHEGVRHDLVPLVSAWLERGRGDDPVLVEQENGRFLEVPAAALKPVATVLDELGEQDGGQDTIRLSRARALALEQLDRALDDAGLDTDWQGAQEPLLFARQLRTLADIDTAGFEDTPVPRALRATLRPYQRAGLGWLNALARHDLCGILADDMGLGKTVQAIAHLLWLRSARKLDGPALVVAPTSLLGNWANEAARFAPRLHVRVWHGQDRHERPLGKASKQRAGQADLVITSYGLAWRDHERLAEHGFGLLVLDEAQQIKNPNAKITRALKSLPIARRLCLTGTPLENHLGELWSQFDFLMPGILGDSRRFTRHYRTPIERQGNVERRERLAEAIRPFLLRRRKEAVATELPPKSEMVRKVLLGDRQARVYESIRVAMQQRVRDALAQRGVAQSRITVLDALLKLRQVCCHPQLVKLPSARQVTESAKTVMLFEMLEELIAEGRRVLVFSQFTSMLTLIERELTERKMSWVKLTGQTRRRDEAIARFQDGQVPLFLISLKAGGTGLNLTAADTVIHYDPWWNPAAEEQASARAHRIGQDKPVFVYRLVTENTVEERIVAMQARKRELAEAVLERGDAGALASMSAEQTLALFDAL